MALDAYPAAPPPDGAGARDGALLSLAESARARPLRWAGGADRARVLEAVKAAVADWKAAWAGGAAPLAVDAVRCEAWPDAADPGALPAAAPWWPLGASLAGLGWSIAGGAWIPEEEREAAAALLSPLHVGLFGEPPRDPRAADVGAASAPGLARELVMLAWDDLSRRVGAALGAAQPQGGVGGGPDPARAWSGEVVVELRWFAGTLFLRVSGDVVARGAPARPRPAAEPPAIGLTDLGAILRRRPLRLHVDLAPVELDVGTLAGLRVGDVLCTAHGLDAPLTVAVEAPGRSSTRPCGTGYVGAAGGALAVELTASAEGPDPVRAAHGENPRRTTAPTGSST